MFTRKTAASVTQEFSRVGHSSLRDQSSSRSANYFAPAISEATSAKHSGQTAKGKRPEKDTSVRGALRPIRTLVYAMRVLLPGLPFPSFALFYASRISPRSRKGEKENRRIA